jgi:hypothetical protein
MRSVYYRKQRASIYHPATIGDIPEEVLRKAFIYLLPGKADLVAPGEACRAWRPVAQELMYSYQGFGKDQEVERFVCGVHLQSLVFGVGNVSISRLDIDTRFVGKENILLLAQISAPSLSALIFNCGVGDDCYAELEVFFLRCLSIRSLILVQFNFGYDPDVISPLIKEGFGRLKTLYLIQCEGDVRMFVETTSVQDLQKFRYESYREDDIDIVTEMAMNYPSLTSIYVSAKFNSSAPILKVIDCCRDLESVYLFQLGGVQFELSDIEASSIEITRHHKLRNE